MTIGISVYLKLKSFFITIFIIYLTKYFIMIIPNYYKFVIWKDSNLRKHSTWRRLGRISIYFKFISIFGSICLISLTKYIIIVIMFNITTPNYYKSPILENANIWKILILIYMRINLKFIFIFVEWKLVILS